MTSLLVSSVIATLLAVVVVVEPSRARGQRSSTFPNSSSAAFAPNSTVAAQPAKTFDQVYRNTICDNQRSCHLVSNVSSTDRTLAVRNCMCDAECNVYGDCCFDSPFYNEDDQRTNFKLFHCSKEKWYVKASCSAGYADHEIARRCADGAKVASNDVRVITPVTDVERNVTYANVYCAICDDRDPRLPSLRPWNVTFRCEVNATGGRAEEERVADGAEASAVASDLRWDDALNEYRSHYRGRAYRCEPLRLPAVDVGLRRCVTVVADCPATADRQLAADCESFALFVHDDALSYRNVFCAQCNNATAPLTGCRPPFEIEDRFSTPQRIFSGTNKATGNAACSDPNVNPDLKKRFCPP